MKENKNHIGVERVSTLTDGLIVIALTLLVIGIDVPTNASAWRC